MAEHPGNRPVLVHRSAQLGLPQPFDQRAEAFALAGVLRDVGGFHRHASVTIPPPGASVRHGKSLRLGPRARGRTDRPTLEGPLTPCGPR